MDHEYDVEGGYIPSFLQHLKDTGARLGLQVGSQVNEDLINAGGPVENAPEAHAPSNWTPAEHDAFFRALSVHSRWRPDLIAACVPTRTEWEIWMYLEALEEGAATLAIQRGGEDVDMEGGFRDERQDVDMLIDRSSSDSRSHSGSDTYEDEDLCEPALEVSQAWIDVEERMASWLVREEHLASVENDVPVTDTEAVDDEPPKRKRGRPRGFEKGCAESTSTSACGREMLMGRLEARHLPVLDSILRGGEEAIGEKNKTRDGSVTAATPMEHRDEGVPRADSTTDDLSLFSPRSRRRIQKRFYMRRKRASLRENDATSKGAVYTELKKLKPGKKANPERYETSTVPTSVPCSKTPSDAETTLPENVSKKSKSGLTFPYKLKAHFTASGIDAAYLRDQGMDLLNLSALGKLMGLYSSLERDEEADESEMVQFIDAELIRHLQAALVRFVTDIIHRAIVWREGEIRLKQRSRAWGHGDQFTIGAVEHAMEVVGARYRSHKEYFKSLGIFHGLETETSSIPANASDEPTGSPVDPDVEAANRSAEPPGVSPHRDVYTPLIRPPSTWGMDPLACLAQTYERETTRTRRGTSAEIEVEELMADETDEDELEAELREDDKADVWDMELAATHEEGLWDAVTTTVD